MPNHLGDMETPQKIAILGATGSIGCQTLEVIQRLKDRFSVYSLASFSNVQLLEKLALEHRPRIVAIFEEKHMTSLRERLRGKLPSCKVVGGMQGWIEAVTHPDVESVVAASTGTLGIVPTLAAIEAGKKILLANKEVLVAAGEIVTKKAREKAVPLFPLDSEHCAILQCLHGEPIQNVRRIILTASGGPFRDYPNEKLQNITPQQALAHPNWKMGSKITVDCSTLMNKGLELIEAHWLFGIAPQKLEAIVHPQSAIHSLVEFYDGVTLAQIAYPDMTIPLQYALTYPERLAHPMRPFDFVKCAKMEFMEPDLKKFPCLKLAQEALLMGGSAPCYLNAANEMLVNLFLQEKLPWIEIGKILTDLMQRYHPSTLHSVEDVFLVEEQAQQEATQEVGSVTH